MEALRQVYIAANGLLGTMPGNPGTFYTAKAPTGPTDLNGIIINNTGATGGSTITLEYADATHPGIISATGQQFGGFKEFQAITAPFVNNDNNVLFGTNALASITTGSNNTAFGQNTLNQNTDGSNNTATGNSALSANIHGNNNSAYGNLALSMNQADSNSAFGNVALQNNVTGTLNCAFGSGALNANNNGNNNSAFGFASLSLNATGSDNVAFGPLTLTRAIGSNNTAVGSQIASKLTTGHDNIIIGAFSATGYIGGETNNIIINNAGVPGENNVIRIGTTQTGNFQAGIYGQTTSQTSGLPVFIDNTGNLANYTPNMIDNFNMVYGYQSGLNLIPNSGRSDSLFGYQAGQSLTDGSQNVILGAAAGNSITTGDSNTIVGYGAGSFSDTFNGTNNILLGAFSGTSFTNDESNNIIIGNIGSNGDSNVIVIGSTQTQNFQAGIANTALGAGAAYVGILGNGQLGVLPSPTGIEFAYSAGAPTGATDQNGILIDNVDLMINLEFADATHNGIVSATGQQFGGFKEFTAITAPYDNILLDNVAFGTNALASITNGTNNTAFGFDALTANTIGHDNVAVGANSLAANVDGDNNVAVGYNALAANTASDNVAIGIYALMSNVTGTFNVGVGSGALLSNVTGTDNTAIGYFTLTNSTTAFNTAVGSQCLASNTEGENNTGIGTNALTNNEDGSNNVAMGMNALAGNIHADQNVAIGNNTLSVSDSLGANTAVGYNSLMSCSGGGNTAVGSQSLENLESGSNNIGIGFGALFNATSVTNIIAIGQDAGFQYTNIENNNIVIGSQGVADDLDVIRIGTLSGTGAHLENFQAGIYGVPLGTGNFVGINANGQLGTLNTLAVLVGAPTGPYDQNGIIINNDTVYLEFANGTYPGIVSVTGQQFSGFKQFQAITAPFVNGNNNTLFGNGALNALQYGIENTAVGSNALVSNAIGNGNTALGYTSLNNMYDGASNVGIGVGASFGGVHNNNNVAVGNSALSLNTGDFNVAIGYNAGSALTSGDNNIMIGANTTGSAGQANAIQIGVQGTQTSCIISGIANAGPIDNASTVLINTTTGQLGSILSAKKYKENIEDMGDYSNDILKLQPVTFTYKTDDTKEQQVGLIADDVEKIFPSLVIKNKEEIETVKYQNLIPMLLNELIKQDKIIKQRTDLINNLLDRLSKLEQ
jgi:hypothetical protein